MAKIERRAKNERKFGNWDSLPNGGRRYWFEVAGRWGWRARYVKEVDNEDQTIRFYQEIYNSKGEFVEIHVKFPFDTGHRKMKE